MKYVVYSLDWTRPIYFCPHEGSGFTVSTDMKKAEVFAGKKAALAAAGHFTFQSNMKCELKRI